MAKTTVSKVIAIMFLSVGLIFLISGCCCKECPKGDEGGLLKSSPVAIVNEQPPEVTVEEEIIVEEVPLEEIGSVLDTAMATKPAEETHVVTKGECLWWIAEYEDVYNDPFMWPLIYDANKDQVQDPDLIYPDQVLKIPRSGYTVNEVESARKTAGAPRPYVAPVESLPPM